MKYLIACLLMCYAFVASAQNSKGSILSLYEGDGVRINAIKTNCDRPNDGIYADYYLVNIENDNAYPVVVTWRNELYYNGECTTCTHQEGFDGELRIEANGIFSASCADRRDQSIAIFHGYKMVKMPRVLTEFKVVDVNVNTNTK